MGMGFQFEQHRLGLWDLSWDLKKTISWEMGLGPTPPTPSPFFTTLFTQVLHGEGKRNLNISALRGGNPRLLAAVM